MGGERASKTRQRMRGDICTRCGRMLPPGPVKERYCTECEPRQRVYMRFVKDEHGWRVTFLEATLVREMPRKFTFGDPAKVEELAVRGGADGTLADREALRHGLSIGKGGVWLHLTSEQMARLK